MSPLVPALAGVLVALSVLALGPRDRSVRGVGAAGRRTSGGRVRRSRATEQVTLEVVVTQVAGLLRSGLPPQRAWELVGGLRVDVHGVPDAGDLVRRVRGERPAGPVRGRPMAGRPVARPGGALARCVAGFAALVPRPGGAARDAQAERQAAAVVAACRLAVEVGAPLAVVLESIVATLVAAAEAEAERDAALAGPQTTARVLLWLPVVGAVLGSALGADPVRLVLDGGLTALAPLVGIVLLLVGRTWSGRLTDRARAAGSPA